MSWRGLIETLPPGGPLYTWVMHCLADRNFSYKEIADGSGVSMRTVEKIARREILDPGVSHIEKLAAFFRAQSEPAPAPAAERRA